MTLDAVLEASNSTTELYEVAEIPETHFDKVSQLKELNSLEALAAVVRFSDFDFNEESSSLVVNVNRVPLAMNLDKLAKRILAKALDKSVSYLSKCPNALAIHNFNYWLEDLEKDPEMLLEYVKDKSGEDRYDILSLRPIDDSALSSTRILNSFISVLDPDSDVVSFDRADDYMSVTVKFPNESVEVPGDGSSDRPKVGDVVQGGLRLTVDSGVKTGISISLYTHRLVCNNGLVSQDKADFKLKGSTVDELVDEVAHVTLGLTSIVKQFLDRVALSASIPLDGNVQLLITHLCQEYGLGSRVQARLLQMSRLMPTQPTVYDLTNMFTSVANEVNGQSTKHKLQQMGGDFVSHPSRITSRCPKCEQTISGH